MTDGDEPEATFGQVIEVFSAIAAFRGLGGLTRDQGLHARVDRTRRGETDVHEVWVFPHLHAWEMQSHSLRQSTVYNPVHGLRVCDANETFVRPPKVGQMAGAPPRPVQLFLPLELPIWYVPGGDEAWRIVSARWADDALALEIASSSQSQLRGRVEIVRDGYARRFETPGEVTLATEVEMIDRRDRLSVWWGS